MSFFDIIRTPDSVTVQTDNILSEMKGYTEFKWQYEGIEVETSITNSSVHILLDSPYKAIKRIKLRWNLGVESSILFLGDHWERAYGDLEWRAMVPERIMPWYFMAFDNKLTHGYGVKTGAGSMCFWQVDPSGITLWLDVRSGGIGVSLNGRKLEAAVVVARKGIEQETPFKATQEFCKLMCDNPRTQRQPVYGGNNWYYAYGNSSHKEIVEDSKFISSMSASDNRPFMVIDDGWQVCHSKVCNGGPWHQGNFHFPDMPGLAGRMTETGVQPGIWLRPLLTSEKIPLHCVLTNSRFKKDVLYQFTNDQYMDPSVPYVIDKITEDIKRIVSWGFKLIKHDFSTCDIFGRWGHEMGSELTNDGWSFSDNSRTTAEIIQGLYKAIREAAGDTLIIGCNTVSHLSAGIFDIQRTGDDTSGLEWERTRKMGVNTLAFRMPQHNTFYAADADCVGITSKIPWKLNRQWMELLAKSSTPLFVSVSPRSVDNDQEKAIKSAFESASTPQPIGEPLDWLQTTCPQKWILNGRENAFDWYGNQGIRFYE